MSTGIIGGNVRFMQVLKATLSPAQVAINTTAEQTFAFVGMRPWHNLNVNKPTSQAGLGIVSARAGTDQFFITFSNNTAGAITPTAAEVYNILLTSPEASDPATKISF